MLFAALFARAQTVPLDVDFKFTDIEYKPLPGQPMRLVFGDGKDWQSPGAGNRFTTDEKGEARFTTPVIIDRRWHSQNIGFTPLSMPLRADHLQIAAELEQFLPGAVNGKDLTLHLLCKMDIDRLPGDDCATSDFTSIYLPGAQGRFTKEIPPKGFTIPDSGGLVLSGISYQTWDHMLEPVDEAKTHWKLKLAFKRYPPPVRR